ncbi:TetR/AcrR family transcriptional regulator [Telmatospirillum sp.]|uniref:TetR/AcrR family transcriptional regulator n=1 Tax=Telmatospirillum sp. TaxID=2079197 RepID=UPI00284A6329|nr:TetR/AcrR family transcriptional regulator [Telmatospirillum sp.]MDR3437722.1 TetR/AcrR family transcriptional regulator [Telmatospirillum sp.]
MTAKRGHGTGGRPPAHEIEERRHHLIQVATRLFLSDGYEATSLENIAKVAGASKTTIYRNIGDKADLFRTVLNCSLEPVWPKLGDVPVDGKSPEEVLSAYGRLVISSSSINSEAIMLLRLVYREASRFPELARIFADAEQSAVDAVAKYLAVAMQQKYLRPSDPDRAAGQFLELIWGPLVRRLILGTIAFPDEKERERIVLSAVSLFLNGSARSEEPSVCNRDPNK